MESNPFQRFSHQLPVIDEIYLIDKLLEHQNLECLPFIAFFRLIPDVSSKTACR